MRVIKTIQFKEWKCSINISSYAINNKIRSILLYDIEDGSPIATASVFHNDLKEDEVGIKDWSENEGMYDTLLKANVIHPYHRKIKSGYVEILVCKLKEI